MRAITRSAFLDELFAGSAAVFGADLEAYRNHALRVLNLALAHAPAGPDVQRKLEIACYFHDVGIWTDGTLDYLEPSARHARAYLESNGRTSWQDEIVQMITEHHKLSSAAPEGALVEAFRKADWTDVSLGLMRFGLPRGFVTEVRRAFPNRGFHRRLVQLALKRMLRHPLRPLPMFKR